jgi:hypothetical protein
LQIGQLAAPEISVGQNESQVAAARRMHFAAFRDDKSRTTRAAIPGIVIVNQPRTSGHFLLQLTSEDRDLGFPRGFAAHGRQR